MKNTCIFSIITVSLALVLALQACGVKGPPLPPLPDTPEHSDRQGPSPLPSAHTQGK